MWEPSYRAKLVAGVCSLVLLTGSVVLWLAHRSARASTDELTGTVFREVSGKMAAQSRGFVLRAAPVVESLAGLAETGLAIEDPERLAPQLLAVLKANPGLSWVSYGDERGTFTGAYRTLEGGLRINRSRITAGKTRLVEHDVLADGTWKVVKEEADSGYDPRTRPFYVKAKRENRLVWLPPYVFFNQGVPGISCATPVKDGAGRLRGVLSVDFDLNALSEFVSGLSVSPNSRVFLFTSDEILLAHPHRRGTGSSGSHGEGRLLSLAEAGDPLVDSYRTKLNPDRFQASGGESFTRFEFRHDRQDHFGSATSFRIGDDQTWVVGVAAPTSDFGGDVWKTQAFALAAAAMALLAALALAFLLANAVSRPVSNLIGFMQRIGGGDLEAKANFGGSREFRQLSDALNKMIGDLRDHDRVRYSLGVAMEVQRRLLPAKPPSVPGLDVAGHSTYCDETGGDYYDFLVLDQSAPNSILVVLGDVMGHGVAAALVMAGVRAVLRDRAMAELSLAELMSRLNRMIAADHSGERFMTMQLSVIDRTTRTMRWVSAGHDPAIVYDPATDNFVEAREGELPLGVMEMTEYHEHTSSPLSSGQIILFGTDGVWEMPNAEGEAYGKDRLKAVIRETAEGTAEEISQAIRQQLATFRGTAKQADDVTFVVVKVLANGT